MKTRKDLENEVAELRSALMVIERGDCGAAGAVARTALALIVDGGGGDRRWQTLVQVRENNNSVPGAVTITARKRWQRSS